MVSVMDALPPEGDEAEARELVSRHPVRLPTYKLERVHVATLNVDYAPHHGTGYARPLSPYRLKQLREEWDPLAVAALTISKRTDNSLWIIDGNHRRYVAYEKGMLQLPALVHSGLSRAQEADLYTKLGTVLGQTPWTRFQAKIVSGDDASNDIIRIAQRFGLELDGRYSATDGIVQAVARVEWVYARGGPDALTWVLAFLTEAFNGDRLSLGSLQLEGAFGFYLRYAELVKRSEVVQVMGPSGIWSWHNRAQALYDHVDVGPRANTFGLAIAEMVNDTRKRNGAKGKDLLPAWEKLGQFGSRFRDVNFRERGYMQYWTSLGGTGTLAPQHLGAA